MTKPVTSESLTIWRLLDGKTGHEKQTQALVELLQEQRNVNCIDIPIKHSTLYYLTCWLLNQRINHNQETTNRPDLAIGAGHRTHIALLAIKRYYRCKALVIMSPSLPSRLYDVIISPRHDYIKTSPPQNVVTTVTALAPKVKSKPIPNQGLILIGGESSHYYWEENRITDNINQIILEHPENMTWQLTTSRRTPKSTLDAIIKNCEKNTNLHIFDYKTLPQNWLAETLQTAGNIWVTADSASMIAEALMTKAFVGLINLEPKKANKKLNTCNHYLTKEGYLKNISAINANKRKRIEYHETIHQVLELLEL